MGFLAPFKCPSNPEGKQAFLPEGLPMAFWGLGGICVCSSCMRQLEGEKAIHDFDHRALVVELGRNFFLWLYAWACKSTTGEEALRARMQAYDSLVRLGGQRHDLLVMVAEDANIPYPPPAGAQELESGSTKAFPPF